MKRLPLALASFAFLLAGCQQHYTVEGPPPGAQPPLPAAPPGQPRPALPPGPVGSAGPLTKAGVEKYMDGQETDLRARLRGTGAVVARRGEVLVVTIPSDKLFERMSLGYEGRSILQNVAQVLAHYDHTAIDVSAYTDTTGSADQNLSISQKRADAVGASLKDGGVAATRVTAKGYGATNLKVIANGADPRNRRIELRVTPKPS
jgi:outer membrane protein OmpA-like peptidoglycan-associated protein